MTPRHIALALAAVAVLGLGVYLYVAVNSTSSATANVRPRAPSDRASPREDDREPLATNSSGSEAPKQAHKINAAVRDAAAPPEVAVTPGERPGANIDIKKDEMMASANKAYDHGDFDEAIMIAKKVLSNDPANTRMLRIMVSASCILDDTTTAQSYYLSLPIGGNDRADMKKRCERYGVVFKES